MLCHAVCGYVHWYIDIHLRQEGAGPPGAGPNVGPPEEQQTLLTMIHLFSHHILKDLIFNLVEL